MKSISKLFESLARDEEGQTLIFVALSMTLVLGFVGLAADVGVLLNTRRAAQTAADAAAIAGAANLNYGSAAIQAGGLQASALDGFTDGTGGASVAINNPPLNGPHASDAGYVEAIVSQTERVTFMSLFLSQPTVTARAVAFSGAPGQACVNLLGSSGTDLLINGSNINVEIDQCSLIDDSNNGSSALLLNGTSNRLTASSIGVVGGVLENGTGNQIAPTPVTGIPPSSNPLAYLNSQEPSHSGCSSFVLNGKSGTLSPGCYSSVTLNGSNIDVTMDPGLYVMTGSFTVNGSNVNVSGAGVTLYFGNHASFTDNGNTTLDLSAPTDPSSAYNGILFWQAQGNTNQLTINGSSSSDLEGIIYVPSAQVVMNGNSSTNLYTSIVAKSLLINGSISLHDYAVLSGVSSPLTAVALVE